MSESDSLSDREHNLRTSAGLADAKQHMVPGGHEFFLLLQSVWIEQGRPLRWSLPSLGASSIQTANRPPAGRLTVAKQFIKVPLSRRGVKGSGVVAAEVRATMPRFDCSQEIRLIWTDAHRLKSKQPRNASVRRAATETHSRSMFGSEWSRYFASVSTKLSWTIVSLRGPNFCNVSVFISHDNNVPGSDNKSRHGVDLQCTNICSIMAKAWEKNKDKLSTPTGLELSAGTQIVRGCLILYGGTWIWMWNLL